MGPQESHFGHACAEPLGESGQGRAGQVRAGAKVRQAPGHVRGAWQKDMIIIY